MKLQRPLPPNRSFGQIKNHYLVEKAIADRLKGSPLEERKLIYATMYDELFSKVPDHPRLTRRKSELLTAEANKLKMSLVSKFLYKSCVFVEFAPGDCRFAGEVAKQVNYVYGVDISDQRNPDDIFPKNFKLVVYDGYNLDSIESNTIDVVFSDQLIEHLHPEDVILHFKLVHRILKVGGKYVFRTPHSLTGPHDVSKYFTDKPECFHLKEWTYIEMKKLLSDLHYSKFKTRWHGHATRINFRMPWYYFTLCEQVLRLLPKGNIRRFAANYLISTLHGVAIK